MISWRRIMKRVGLTYTLLFLLVAVHLELSSYVFNTYSWPKLSKIPKFDPKNPFRKQPDEPLRVLIVADPQLIGETDEIPFLGIFTRWDADRYLSRTYRLARYHVQPDVVVFLGDLFDEGSKATDDQAARYIARFKHIFHIQLRNRISYMYLPGDNDVGGENEPIFEDKVKWFNDTVGNIETSLVWKLREQDDIRARFMKMHLFLPDVFVDPIANFDPNTSKPEVRIALSHISCLKIFTHICAQRLERTSPALILSGDSHRSTYYQLKQSRKKMRRTPQARVAMYTNFLVSGQRNISYESDMFHPSVEFRGDSLRLHLKFTNGTGSRLTHEITVPTCSYRMGVPNMGYGSLQIYQNGTVDYTVLWLPSRYHQLYVYVGFYILSKFIFTPWIFWRVSSFLWNKYLALRSRLPAQSPFHKHHV